MNIYKTTEQDHKRGAETVNQAEYSMIWDHFGVQSFIRRSTLNVQVGFVHNWEIKERKLH